MAWDGRRNVDRLIAPDHVKSNFLQEELCSEMRGDNDKPVRLCNVFALLTGNEESGGGLDDL